MINLVFFLEELSAKALLEGLIPRVLPAEKFYSRYIPFEGKQDLERQLVRKMRSWRAPHSFFIVLRDQDAGDCHQVKKKLRNLCKKAGHPEALVRVACREMESWFLGDLSAVERALGVKGLSRRQSSKKLRDPDVLHHPSTELEKLTGYVYQKVSGSRAIGPQLNMEGSNASHSFQVFISGLKAFLHLSDP